MFMAGKRFIIITSKIKIHEYMGRAGILNLYYEISLANLYILLTMRILHNNIPKLHPKFNSCYPS